MIKDLVPKSDTILRTPCEPFDFSNPQTDPVQLYNDLGESLAHYQGIGLAANQIGYPYQVFVIRSSPIIPFFNPKITDVSDEVVEMEEGCLTFPGIVVKVKRPRVIMVRFADPTGKVETKKFQDMTARVIQHEMDHLQGILFTQYKSRVALEMAIKKAKKLGHNYTIGDLI